MLFSPPFILSDATKASVCLHLSMKAGPHANDPGTRPVVVAVCFEEGDSRYISGRIHAMKRDILGKENAELKGRSLINRTTYRRQTQAVAFAEEFFDALRNFPVTIFATIMEAPFESSEQASPYLENRFRFLLQPIELNRWRKSNVLSRTFTLTDNPICMEDCPGGFPVTFFARPRASQVT